MSTTNERVLEQMSLELASTLREHGGVVLGPVPDVSRVRKETSTQGPPPASFERLGHLLCELFERLHAVGLVREGTFELPLTQPDLADTLALSAVHVNRTLMELRRSGLVSFQSKQLVIHDYGLLQRAAGFDAQYLYLTSPAGIDE